MRLAKMRLAVFLLSVSASTRAAIAAATREQPPDDFWDTEYEPLWTSYLSRRALETCYPGGGFDDYSGTPSFALLSGRTRKLSSSSDFEDETPDSDLSRWLSNKKSALNSEGSFLREVHWPTGYLVGVYLCVALALTGFLGLLVTLFSCCSHKLRDFLGTVFCCRRRLVFRPRRPLREKSVVARLSFVLPFVIAAVVLPIFVSSSVILGLRHAVSYSQDALCHLARVPVTAIAGETPDQAALLALQGVGREAPPELWSGVGPLLHELQVLAKRYLGPQSDPTTWAGEFREVIALHINGVDSELSALATQLTADVDSIKKSGDELPKHICLLCEAVRAGNGWIDLNKYIEEWRKFANTTAEDLLKNLEKTMQDQRDDVQKNLLFVLDKVADETGTLIRKVDETDFYPRIQRIARRLEDNRAYFEIFVWFVFGLIILGVLIDSALFIATAIAVPFEEDCGRLRAFLLAASSCRFLGAAVLFVTMGVAALGAAYLAGQPCSELYQMAEGGTFKPRVTDGLQKFFEDSLPEDLKLDPAPDYTTALRPVLTFSGSGDFSQLFNESYARSQLDDIVAKGGDKLEETYKLFKSQLAFVEAVPKLSVLAGLVVFVSFGPHYGPVFFSTVLEDDLSLPEEVVNLLPEETRNLIPSGLVKFSGMRTVQTTFNDKFKQYWWNDTGDEKAAPKVCFDAYSLCSTDADYIFKVTAAESSADLLRTQLNEKLEKSHAEELTALIEVMQVKLTLLSNSTAFTVGETTANYTRWREFVITEWEATQSTVKDALQSLMNATGSEGSAMLQQLPDAYAAYLSRLEAVPSLVASAGMVVDPICHGVVGPFERTAKSFILLALCYLVTGVLMFKLWHYLADVAEQCEQQQQDDAQLKKATSTAVASSRTLDERSVGTLSDFV